MVRLLIDESLPRAVTRLFAAGGHDVLDARDAGLRGHPDAAILARATAEQRIVASGDLDFANALRFPPGSHPGIVVLRVPDDWPAQRKAERLLAAMQEVDADRIAGAIVIVEPLRLRIFGS